VGLEEKDLEEKKKAKKSDRCTRIAKRKYDVWPSAYASGAVVKCRQGKIWKGVKEGEEPGLEIKIRKALRDEGGAAGMDALVDHAEASESDIKAAIKDMDDVGQHKNGDYILDDGEDIDILEEDLRKWFGRKGEKGSKGGWVDCNAPDGEGGYKECAQGDRKKKPACRPTPSACKDPGKGKKWGKKATKEALNMKITKEELEQIIFEEVKEVYYETFIFPHLTEAWLEDGTPVCTGCLHELLNEASCDCPDLVYEAEYQGRKVTLNKPTRGDVKKFKVYVKDPKTGNIKKVNFGHGGSSAKAKGEKTMKIRKSNPKARKSFRARHNCDNPGPKTKARYWSCKKW
jgi:hypothetical protein